MTALGGNVRPYNSLHSQQIALQLGIAVIAGPQIEGSRGQFVNEWLSATVLGHIHGLDVGLAGVATFHANVIEVSGRIHREILVVLLAASGADDAAKLPLGKTKR